MAAIIFDFDGTIANSFDFVVHFLQQQLPASKQLTAADREKLRGLSMQEMATEMGFARWRMLLLFLRGRQEMGRIIYDVPLFVGMSTVIDKLHAEGHTLYVVSSNNSRNIRKFFKQHHVYKHFTDIYGGAGFFGKRRAIQSLIYRDRLQLDDVVYIGDETRDVTAAKAVNCRVIAVAWGFATEEALQALEPNAIAREPTDIISILEEW